MSYDLLLDPKVGANKDRLISHQEAIQDIKVLIYALENAYPAVWTMTPSDWSQIISNLEKLQLPQSLSSKQFGTILADVLWDIPDGHLKVRLGAENLGEKHHASMRRASTGSNISKGLVWKIEYMKADSQTVPIVGISWFPQSSETHWNGFLEEVTKLTSFPNIIFDLRGNPGGDDSKAVEMMSTLLGSPLEFDWIRDIVCESTAAYTLQANTYSKIIWNGYTSKNLTPPLELEKKLASFKEKAAALQGLAPRKEIIESSPSIKNSSQPKYTGKVHVLIDAETSSSGEWTALYLKRHPNTVLVGENTSGMIHFGNSGTLRLPNSHLEVTLCMKINELTDGSFYEKTGIPADIPVKNQDSLTHVLSNLISP
ncbi:S41 family peptidase [Bdellovibrio sp. HCB290]|uniref:S41 family peptidase n=1 Tax=Bdellovibrio sp. HCB290 TaxID=3394356 RepID=UPI0039B4BFE4